MGVDKKNLTEEDIKFRYITPAITARWKPEQVAMEAKAQITDGQIELRGNLVARKRPGRVDYLLSAYPDYPIAVVEAKGNKYPVSEGLAQAMDYAQMLDVKFAYSSNGDAFREHDFFTGAERDFPLSEFPSPDELLSRYEAGINHGTGLNQQEKVVIQTPFFTSQNTYPPRYYQRVAVNRTLDAIARGQDRILLVMATGTGKTYTAFQIVYRLLKSELKQKVLYLADRNNLVEQSIQQDFAPLKNTIHKINFVKDKPHSITAFEVYFSLYQQLAGDASDDDTEEENSVEKLQALFRPDFFDLIIVDECHRGSAKKDSNWRRVLEYFSSATQIGMTATPRETKYISNIDYFGEPVYTYSLRKGIEDGFLAPFKVINIHTNIGDGWRPVKGQRDIYGNEIEDRIYNNCDYDYHIILEDRIHEVAKEITAYLHSVGRMDKTIVFCANEKHALLMRNALVDLNRDMVKEYPDYVVRITGSDDVGKKKLKYFTSVSSSTPVIATTSELLSTGTDCKMVKLIVLDQMINSMTKFKQIIGRGTRLRWNDGKKYFVVMDFRNVTSLFSDPDWDGPIEQNDGYDPDAPVPHPGPVSPPPGPVVPIEKPVVDANGCPVVVWGKTVSIYDPSGKLLRQENIVDYTRSNVLGEYASLDNFIRRWSDEEKKETIRALFWERGIDLEAMKADQNMTGVDDFDFICHVAFDRKPLTRRERAENVKKRDFLSKYSGTAREVLETLLERYMNTGIYEIEKAEVLRLDAFKRFGKPGKIASLFGGAAGYQKAVRELEQEIYKAG